MPSTYRATYNRPRGGVIQQTPKFNLPPTHTNDSKKQIFEMANNLVPGPAPIAQEVQHSVVEALQQMFKEMNARFTALESKIDAVNANCNARYVKIYSRLGYANR